MARNKGSARGLFFSLYLWVLAGFGLRLWRVFYQLVMWRDETAYAFEIKHVLNGTIFQDPTYYTFPPAYALLAAPVAALTGDPELAGRLITCVAGAAAAIPVYYLTRDLFGQRAAAAAAAVTALFPPLFSIGVMSESTYSLLVMLCLYLGHRAYKSGRGRDYFLFGLVMAISYLTRPEGFFIFFAYLFLLAALIWKKTGTKKVTALAGAALLGFFLLAFPYMAQIRAHFGAWYISGKVPINLVKVKAEETLRPGEDPERHEAEVSRQMEGEKRGLGMMLAQFSAMAKRYPGNLMKEVKDFSKMVGAPLLAAFVLGISFIAAGRCLNPAMLLGLAAYAPFFVIPAVFVLDRVLVPYLPLLIVPAGYGIARLSEAVADRLKGGEALASGACVFFSAALFIGNFGGLLPQTDVQKALYDSPSYSYYYTLRQIAGQARARIPPDSRIITRNDIFAYYAGGEYLPIPPSGIGGLMKYAADNEAGYLFYGPMERDMRPQLYPVLFQGDGYPKANPLGDGSLRLAALWGDDFALYEFTGRGAR